VVLWFFEPNSRLTGKLLRRPLIDSCFCLTVYWRSFGFNTVLFLWQVSTCDCSVASYTLQPLSNAQMLHVTGSISPFIRLYFVVDSVDFVGSVGRKPGSVEGMTLFVLGSCSRQCGGLLVKTLIGR